MTSRNELHAMIQRALCALALIGSFACTTSDPTNQVQYFPLAFSNFTAAVPLVVPTPGTLVFRDQADWDAFWLAHTNLVGPAPVVDFSQDMLVAVFWGSLGTGCFDFVNAIVRVRARVDGLNTFGVIEVDVGTLPPLGSCATPVNPFQVISIEATCHLAPPILPIVSISRRRRRSDKRKTSAAVAIVAIATIITAATMNC